MSEIKLKGGFVTQDPRLDRIPEFDEASRQFPIRALVRETAPIRSRRWPCGIRLDQGSEGACVGFGWSHELAAWPYVVKSVDDAFARAIYKAAQLIDEWPGEAYSGTSVLAGAKVIRQRGYMPEFRWAFGVDDVLRTLANYGPVVIGVPWHEGMANTRPSGLIRADGAVTGGHCTLLRGVLPGHRLQGEAPADVVVGRNSWGRGWGVGGDFFLTFSDLDKLLKNKGEACVPVVRRSIVRQAATLLMP